MANFEHVPDAMLAFQRRLDDQQFASRTGHLIRVSYERPGAEFDARIYVVCEQCGRCVPIQFPPHENVELILARFRDAYLTLTSVPCRYEMDREVADAASVLLAPLLGHLTEPRYRVVEDQGHFIPQEIPNMWGGLGAPRFMSGTFTYRPTNPPKECDE